MSKLMNLGVLVPIAFVAAGCGGKAKEQPQSGMQLPSYAAPARPNEVLAVTRDFGQAVVKEGEFEAESSTKPWSSWWYPVSDTYLFDRGQFGPAPLQKYDSYVKATRAHDPGSAQYEKDKIYDPNAASWEGLCNAWSKASLMEPEPSQALDAGGIHFEVGDLKAILVKSYETLEGTKQYGLRYNGERGDDFDDIYPDQFHRFLQAQLFEKGRPFIMDKDPGEAVWNTPVWKAQVRVSKDPHDPTVMHVDTWLWGASPFVDSYNYVGTLTVAYEYTYDLFGDAQADGSIKVKYGKWTGQSADYHPDFVTALPDHKNRASLNPAIDPSIVDEILANARH